MDASLFIAKTGLTAQQTRMQVISNNLANVNTTGFKKDRAVFEDLLFKNVVPGGGQADAQTQTPTGLEGVVVHPGRRRRHPPGCVARFARC